MAVEGKRRRPAFVAVDVETTGLFRHGYTPALLEVAMVVLNEDLEQLGHYVSLVHPTSGEIDDLVTASDDVAAEMHQKSGLWRELRRATNQKRCDEVEADMLRLLRSMKATGLPLLGSSVHYDRQILQTHMPEFEASLHYRNVDVTTMKILVDTWALDTVPWHNARDSHHRAYDDIKQSIGLLRYYRKTIFEGQREVIG